MKKCICFIVALGVCGFISAQSKNMVVIKGTMKGDLKGYDKIHLFTRTEKDSTVIKDGQYTFSFPFSKPGIKILYTEYTQKMSQMYRPFGILITGPGTYYVTSDVTDLYKSSEVKGPQDAVMYRTFEKEQDKSFTQINLGIRKLYGDQWYKIGERDPQYVLLQKSRDSLYNVYLIPLIEQLIKSHANSYVSAFVLLGAKDQISSLEKKEKLYAGLSPKMKQSDAGKNFADFIQGVKNSKIGNTVENFTLLNPGGKEIDLKNLKGKYVLIDFWASWCAPCRQSFPHMREVYKQYKSDKFEIYSISIDEDKNAWLQAVQEENNPWLQALDTKNIAKKDFAVTGIPTTFLIDPDGKIIAKEVGFDSNGGSEIEKKIKEIASSKNIEKSPKTIPAMRMN